MESDQNHQILKRFLERPHNRRNFDAFFKLCYRLVLGFLGYLKATGYQLPVETISGRNPPADLAIDLLGSFLRSDKNQPFWLIFDHYARLGITDFQRADSVELYDSFKSLLFGFVRQELHRLRKDADPQLGHLKRRLKDILKEKKYVTFSKGQAGVEYIHLAGDDVDLRIDYPIIPYDQLLELVESAYHKSRNRSEWSHNIFVTLSDMKAVRNCLKKHELISAAVAINMKYVEAEGFQSSAFPSTDFLMREKVIENARKQTLTWLEKNVLEKFIEKGRLSPETAKRFLVAAEMYLLDLAYSPGIDLLPVYFREVMPESEHRRYLQDYKYLFETTLSQAEEDFKRQARKNL